MPFDADWLSYFHFLRPWWAVLIVPWALIILVMNRRAEGNTQFEGIIAPHLLKHLRVKRYQSNWFNPRRFTEAITVLLIIVLMGPSWRQQDSPLSEDASALVILLDVSASMRQRDVQPSRLRRAKQKISDLLSLRPDKKSALIAYAGSAHTVLTLTADRDILNQYVAAITTDIMPRPGKFPEYALPQIDKILSDSSAPATVVMFTDGTSVNAEQAFREYFDARPHQLLIVGTGDADQESDIPLADNALKALARASGGDYVSLTVDDRDMRQVNRRVESHYVVLDDNSLPWLDSGYPLVFPAMALFLLWFRRGWTLTWCWIVLPALLSAGAPPALAVESLSASDTVAAAAEESSPKNEAEQPPSGTSGPETPTIARRALGWFANLWLTPDQQGRVLMQLGHYTEAAQQFEDTQWIALANYYAEDFLIAAEYFARSDTDNALFNEANSRAHARDYVRSVHRYDRLLARSPDFPGARANRDKVQALIDEINRISESQQQEQGVSGEDVELSPEDAIPAQGADELSWEKESLLQLSAEDILGNPETAAMWLKAVQQDPSDFLAIKFSMQLEASANGASATSGNAGEAQQNGDDP